MTITGYCFSASLPPLLSAAAIKALDRIEKHPEMLETLRERSISLHQRICDSELHKFFTLKADELSPLKHLYLKDQSFVFSEQRNILNNIVNYVSISSQFCKSYKIFIHHFYTLIIHLFIYFIKTRVKQKSLKYY